MDGATYSAELRNFIHLNVKWPWHYTYMDTYTIGCGSYSYICPVPCPAECLLWWCCCCCVWDIDGLFNNRLLQIEQLVRRSELYTRYTGAYTRGGGVCVYIWDGQEKTKGKKRRNISKRKKSWDESSSSYGGSAASSSTGLYAGEGEDISIDATH